MDLEEWRMNGVNLLKELVKHQDIERDNFDFKSTKLNKLDEVLCAMANTTTGILCLGVDNPTSETNPNSTFRPDGFRKNTKDETLNSINNFVVKVDPIPIVNHCTFDDEAGDSFYVILKVQGLINQRPYMIKGKGQIWVRIGASTMPATRTTIATLFVNQLERRNSVRKLQVHCRLLRSQLIQTAQVIDGVNREYTDIIPPLDLQPFKDAVSSAEWFLSEQNLLGQVNTTGPTVVLYQPSPV
jgi:schlafen family protein